MNERDYFREILNELYLKVSLDPEIRSIMKKIEKRNADFSDTARLSGRVSDLLGEVLSSHVEELPEGMREAVCKALLRERYSEMNDILAEVQEALDEAQGLHLNPVKAPFPAERVQQLAHSLEDPGVPAETIMRRANTGTANVSRSFHDDYIMENARVRNDLGLKCYIQRVAGGKPCKWCEELAGRYAYGAEPKDVYRRHDNCKCTVTFISGRERQDVWSKRSWETAPELPQMKPTVFTQEQAQRLEQQALQGLTLAGRRDIIRVADSGKDGIPITDTVIDSLPEIHVFQDEQLNLRLHKQAADLLAEAQTHTIGTELAKIIPLNSDLPIPDTIVGEESGFTVIIPKCSDLSITLHNHPSGSTFSDRDIRNFVSDRKANAMAVVGNNGKWYVLKKNDDFDWIKFERQVFFVDTSKFSEIILKEASNFGFTYYEI